MIDQHGGRTEQNQTFNLSEAAQFLGVGRSALLTLLRSGTLPGEKNGGRWAISKQACEGFAAQRSAGNHPAIQGRNRHQVGYIAGISLDYPMTYQGFQRLLANPPAGLQEVPNDDKRPNPYKRTYERVTVDDQGRRFVERTSYTVDPVRNAKWLALIYKLAEEGRALLEAQAATEQARPDQLTDGSCSKPDADQPAL